MDFPLVVLLAISLPVFFLARVLCNSLGAEVVNPFCWI